MRGKELAANSLNTIKSQMMQFQLQTPFSQTYGAKGGNMICKTLHTVSLRANFPCFCESAAD